MVAVGELARSHAEAKAEGKRLYFTGKPCPRGHVANRYVSGGCVECVKHDSAKWHIDNPDKVRAKDAAWRQRNPEKALAKNSTPAKLASNARWQSANRAKRRAASTKWREANRDKARAAVMRWQLDNPDKVRHYVRKRQARKKGATEHCTPEQIADLRKRSGKRCWACRRNVRLTIDHIIPLSKGGSDGIRNIQFLCKPCNSAKRDKSPEDFARSVGRLI